MTKEHESMQSNYIQFLYVVVKECSEGRKGRKIDTELRIVYWKEEWGSDYESQFVVYGKRPNTKTGGEYIPYRLRFNTKEQVVQFVDTVISTDCSLCIELHQFSGINNDSDDEYNIDWFNTSEDVTTELVAFDIDPNLLASGETQLNYQHMLNNVLSTLSICETV